MKPILVGLLWLGLMLGAAPVAYAKTPGEIEVGAVLPDALMKGLSGPSRKLSEFRGKPLVINVWASWCAPCRAEMASLERLSRVKGGEQFTVIGISTDDYPERAKGFLAKEKTSFSHFIDSKLVLENMLGADRLPLTVLVSPQGKVLAKYYGGEEWDSPRALMLVARNFNIKL